MILADEQARMRERGPTARRMAHGSQVCEHGRRRNLCKECHGSQICEHGIVRSGCKSCGGSRVCEHKRQRGDCKECGAHRLFLKAGFTVDEIKEMGAVTHCQFPHCRVRANGRGLHSDHTHDGNKINPENYRGEICRGHNLLLADLDDHPEWANAEAKRYMRRRPYSRQAATEEFHGQQAHV
jgi:hypothetical protein